MPAKTQQLSSQAGFTLLEVLVAATILFTAMGTAMVAYQTAMQGSYRSAQVLSLYQYVPQVRMHVQKAIRDTVLESEPLQLSGVTTLAGIQVNWAAQRIESASPVEQFNVEQLSYSQFDERFHLYLVDLTLSSERMEREFQYVELAWGRRASQSGD